jgi:type 1 glutamine amidotransferase
MNLRILLTVCCLSLANFAWGAEPANAKSGPAKPIKTLLIVGGCCHDYDHQKQILSEGISARANVEFDIVQQGGTATDSKIELYENLDWYKGYDVVIHDECFSDAKEVDWMERIIKPHREGLPAVVIHCAMHCYRAPTDEWFKFVGVTSPAHGAHYGHPVKCVNREHPIMQGYPKDDWVMKQGELYYIDKVWPNTTPLCTSPSRERKADMVSVWTNTYGKGRVFGTTLGHHNETVQDPVYLDFVTRGLLWSVNKLGDDGKPLAGYQSTQKPKPPAKPEPEPTLAK